MIETNQFLERYRLLSRDLQNSLQTLQKDINTLKNKKDFPELTKISSDLAEVSEYWQDFVGWVLISTLDDVEEAKNNCTAGRLDVQSKFIRAKHKLRRDLSNRSINFDTCNVGSAIIETYIPYFEQMLDLILSNSIKYAPSGGHIEASVIMGNNTCRIMLSSMGPLVEKHEKPLLGTKGFRSEAAKQLTVPGNGVGLFNVIRIAELLKATISFRPTFRTAMHIGNVPYADFEVDIMLPTSI